MTVPADLRYTAEHEWVAIKDTTATIGITAYAAEALGDVVYVSVPGTGTSVQAGEPCGEVESVKSVSDIYSPVDGEVTEVNEGVEEDPGIVNADPYGEGWLFKVALTAGEEPSGLMSPDEYTALTAEGKDGQE